MTIAFAHELIQHRNSQIIFTGHDVFFKTREDAQQSAKNIAAWLRISLLDIPVYEADPDAWMNEM